MSPDQLEFAISQYHDGTLPPLERATLDEILATDAGARELLGEYQRLDALVKKSPGPIAIDWNALHSRISESLSGEIVPVQSYLIGGWSRYAAVAAAILVVIGITVPMLRNSRRDESVRMSRMSIEIAAPGGNAVGQISVQSLAESNVSIGPSPQVADAGWRYDDAFLARAGRVVIAASPEAGQDMHGDVSPPF